MKPLNLPNCTATAVERLELFSPANGRLCGSLDAVVHTCDEHIAAARQAAEANGMSAWPVYGVSDLGTCGRVVDFGALLGETEMTAAELDNHEIQLRRKAMPEGVRVTFDFGGPLTGVVVGRVPWAPPGTISVQLDSNSSIITPRILQDEVRPITEPFHPDGDCHDDPAVGGDVEQRCALTETCTLRCYIRFTEGEPQPNDWMYTWGIEKVEQ